MPSVAAVLEVDGTGVLLRSWDGYGDIMGPGGARDVGAITQLPSPAGG